MKRWIRAAAALLGVGLALTALTLLLPIPGAAAELLTPHAETVTLYQNTGCPSGDAAARYIIPENLPADWQERFSCRWSVGDEAVAAVDQTGRVTAVAPGETTVTYQLTRLSNGKRFTAMTVAVVVAEGGGGVSVANVPQNSNLYVGDTLNLSRKIVAGSGADETDRTTWEVSDPAVASVDDGGVVTALTGGGFTVWAKLYDASGDCTAVSPGVSFSVITGITGARQLTETSVELSFAAAMSGKLSKEDFSVRESDGTLLGVESVEFAAGGKRAELKVYAAFTEGRKYTIRAGDIGSITFTASAGEGRTVTVLSKYAKAGEATEILYTITNADGKELYRGSETENILTRGDAARLLIASGDAQADEMRLMMEEEEDTATVTVRYYASGEGAYVESKPVLITAVEDVTQIASVSAYTVTPEIGGKTANWDAVRVSVRMGENNRYLQLKARDKDNNMVYSDSDAADGWRFTSLNTKVLQINAQTGALIPVAEGTATVVCAHNDFTFSASVIVLAAAEPENLLIRTDKTTLNVPESGTDSTILTVSVYDEKGDQIDMTEDAIGWTFVAGQDLQHPTIQPRATEGTVTFTVTAGQETDAGTYQLRFTCGEAFSNITITVAKAVDTVEITGGVTWYDDGTGRPASVTLTLYADGKTSGSPVTVNAQSNWSHTWTGLPASANGVHVVYTVSAGAPAGYLAEQLDNHTVALCQAILQSASFSRDESGNVLLHVAFTGTLDTVNSAWVTVRDSGGNTATVYSAAVNGASVTLNLGALPDGTWTVSYTAAYGTVTVSVTP